MISKLDKNCLHIYLLSFLSKCWRHQNFETELWLYFRHFSEEVRILKKLFQDSLILSVTSHGEYFRFSDTSCFLTVRGILTFNFFVMFW